MNKSKILGMGTIAIALVLSIVSVTIAFAAYNTNLTINGSATMKGTNWSITFSDLQPVVLGNEQGGDVVSTAKEIKAPTITGDTAIGDYSVELATPGDYAIYNFTINNTGSFNAVIDTSFVMPVPDCTNTSTDEDSDDWKKVCDNLEYTLTYVKENPTEGEDLTVKAGDTLAVGDSKDVQLKIYYKKELATQDSSALPFKDVKIGGLNITIPYVQS